ncbi:hypothetical protein JUJ52_05340 [Virgibacillus sp. AGTR]|uniref:hypothetical protein n=1 Tax=Virgibacillus sp. AGTR TaxID=2812055 RepID=UPI001D054C96|nr:hypothetical protein [Virgibacillus sp. AGTR]MCC2249387.1 hypothetical protein [Virgibacillus sp. AGTR]
MGKIIVGPTIETEMSEKQITQIMDLFKGYENKRNLIDYYRTVAVISREQLLVISKEVYYMIYQKRLEKTLVKQQNSILEPKDMQIENADLELSKGRRDFIFHSNFTTSAYYWNI